jgi:predicted nucleic acid-binding protein
LSIVVDSSVLVAATVDVGPNGIWAERIIGEHSIFGPEIVLAETLNILRRLELATKITGFEATAAYQDCLQLNLESFPFSPFAERVWTLRSTLTSYDAWYVAVAEALDLPLATLDGRLTRAPGPKCQFLSPSR